MSRFIDLDERRIPSVLFLHHLLFHLLSRSGSLSDVELGEILTTLGKTFRTRAKGVLYTHQSESPHLQVLAEWLARALSERERIPGAPTATDDDIGTVVEKVSDAVTAHAKDNSRMSYLELAARVFSSSLQDVPELELPVEMGDAPPPSRLIVPP